jgi:hypothetical protein
MHWHPYRNTPIEQHKSLWINELRQRVKKTKKVNFSIVRKTNAARGQRKEVNMVLKKERYDITRGGSGGE